MARRMPNHFLAVLAPLPLILLGQSLLPQLTIRRRHDPAAFANREYAVRFNVSQAFLEAAWPMDLNQINPVLRAESEVKTKIAPRQVTAASSHVIVLHQFHSHNPNLCANGIEVAPSNDELKLNLDPTR